MELMIVVAIIGLLAAIAIPNFARARTASQVQLCIANLRQLDDSKQQWALQYGKVDSSVPTSDDIIPFLRANVIPTCPANGTYSLRRVARTPVCSFYLVGHTLNPDNPAADALGD